MMSDTMSARRRTIVRARIPGQGKIEDADSIYFSCVFARRPAGISILAFPTLHNAGVGEHGFKLAELMDGGFLAINMWQAKVSNLSHRPLRAVMDLSAQNDPGADIPIDIDENKVLRSLRCAAIVLAKSREVGFVLDDDHAVEGLEEHRAQWNRRSPWAAAARFPFSQRLDQIP